MAFPGTQLAVADTLDGEAVTFTTSPERVAELRSRVHAMADMHDHHLVVTPNDPADVDRLRSTVRMHAEHMRQTGACEMDHHGKM